MTTHSRVLGSANQGRAIRKVSKAESGKLENQPKSEGWRDRAMPQDQRAEEVPEDTRTEVKLGFEKTKMGVRTMETLGAGCTS